MTSARLAEAGQVRRDEAGAQGFLRPAKVLGRAASAGDYYSEHEWAGATFYLSSSNAVHLTETSEGIWNAVSGDQWLIRNGEIVAQPDQFGAYPRTAMALNEPANELLLVVVDGKQPPHSAGATLPELARLLHARGAHQAINLDGGGSATLVAADSKGKPVVLNSPIHTRIPGRQRPVANHLGIRIRSRGEAPN